MVRSWLRQLVVNTRTHAIQAVDNSEARDALEFETRKTMAPRLGTSDLCRLASHSEDFGYVLLGVTVRDPAMHALSMDAEERVEEEVISALRQGAAPDAQKALDTAAQGPLTLVSVRLADERTGESVEIGRMGAFQSSTDLPLDKLVRPAFSKLQLT